MVPAFFTKYCIGFFGHTEEEAIEAFTSFKGGAGGLVGTKWGNELSHLCWCLDIALCAQSTLRVQTDEHSNYLGCILMGGGFTITLKDERTFTPKEFSRVASDMMASSPHLRAMNAIANSLYSDVMERSAFLTATTDCHKLRTAIYHVGLTESRLITIRSHLQNLHFPGTQYLTPTSENIRRVLTRLAEADSSQDVNFPLAPSFILTDSRDARLWSAFGALAPSFLVPGGKAMSLSSSFEVAEKKKDGPRESRVVTKVGVMLKDIATAVNDLESVKRDRVIHNPHGSAVMTRVSSDSIIRSFEREGASMVLGALRAYCGVSVTTAGPSKRKRDEGDDGNVGPSKRVKMLDF